LGVLATGGEQLGVGDRGRRRRGGRRTAAVAAGEENHRDRQREKSVRSHADTVRRSRRRIV
jgi:hypothetical protein